MEHNPYPAYTSAEYLAKYYPVKECYLDSKKTVPAPSIYSWNGIPKTAADPVFGSYKLLGLRDDVCFERFGRYGPYGFGYDENSGGLGVGSDTEQDGNEEVWQQDGKINYGAINGEDGLNWNQAQAECYDANKWRFQSEASSSIWPTMSTKKLVPRSAVILRIYTGFDWSSPTILHLRALITELSLKSGGEYRIHLLMHVKNDKIPIYADEDIYRAVIHENVPPEFRDMVTLWSEKYMKTIYSTPFGKPFAPQSPLAGGTHGAYRGLHMSLQWFAHQHPEYEYFWNWEMDIRYTGHYYELFDRLGGFAQNQSRKGLWDRNAKFYIPALHGSWEDFTELVALEHAEDKESSNQLGAFEKRGHMWYGHPLDFPDKQWLPDEEFFPPPGCSTPSPGCGVGEEADLITLNPMFDPNDSGWILAKDLVGYNTSFPIPPRRTSLVAAGRFSKKLLSTMHSEMVYFGHSAFPEMFPATISLHHGFKAVFAPHPVYFDRKWPLEEVERKFNGGKYGSTGGNESCPFNLVNEPLFGGTSWYYNAGFAGALWRRWLGIPDGGQGGREFEEQGSGRMCLRGTLMHPVKWED